MGKNPISKLSNAFSTGGGGTNFEQQVQAMFLLSLLVEGFCPAIKERTKKVCFQAKRLGYDADDLAVFTDRNSSEGKLLCQIKHKIIVSDKNKIFKSVIASAWKDFNKDNFDKKRDKIALVTAQISSSALSSLRFLHAQAKSSINETDFIYRVTTPSFANTDASKVMEKIKTCISECTKGNPSDLDLWYFFKAFIVLLFDLDCEESINRALSSSLIGCNSSSNDPNQMWSRLVAYAGECNQSGAFIDLNNFEEDITNAFSINKLMLAPEPITAIDLFIPTVALIGAWQEDNLYDQAIITEISGENYSEFVGKAKSMLVQNPEYIQLHNKCWKIRHKEDLLKQCKDKIFEDCLVHLFAATEKVLKQANKRVMCEQPFYSASESEYDNSSELRRSLIESVCLVKKLLPALHNCNDVQINKMFSGLVYNVLNDATWTTWASLGDCLQELAQISPEIYLEEAEKGILNQRAEILKLFPEKNHTVFFSTEYVSNLIISLMLLAWSPEYLVKSINILGLLESLPYENRNYGITPLDAIVSILLPWYPQTLGDVQKRKNSLQCLKNENAEVFWNVLIRILPNQRNYTTSNPKPKYLALTIPAQPTITYKEMNEFYDYLLNLAVDIVESEPKKAILLIEQIKYMSDNTLNTFLDCIESESDDYDKEFAFAIWLALREQIFMIKPNKEMVLFYSLNKVEKLIAKIKPQDIRLRYKELYLGNIHLCAENAMENTWKIVEKKKERAIREIYEKFGVEEVERFGDSVNKKGDVARKLGKTLSTEEMSEIIKKYSLNIISKEFAVSCCDGFTWENDINLLLETSLKDMKDEIILDLLTGIPFYMELYGVVLKLLPDDTAYWKNATMPYCCAEADLESLSFIVKKLISCKRYVTAVNYMGHSKFEEYVNAKVLYEILLCAGTENSIEDQPFDNNAVQKMINWLNSQKDVDMNELSDLDFIYLPILSYDTPKLPKALYTRLSVDPDYFCDMIELYYKKTTAKKYSMGLGEAITERLTKIFLNFTVIPGMDLNGNFSESIFKSWMKSVKERLANDCIHVAMTAVGSGLSYAELDEDGLPNSAIMRELNLLNNESLRNGYYLGIINRRGVYTVDPEGKPEIELARKYNGRAEKAEAIGYLRYAEVLRKVATQYEYEAKEIIAEHQKSND